MRGSDPECHYTEILQMGSVHRDFMKTFDSECDESDMDFLAFTVAFMEIEDRGITARSVASNMPPKMAQSFFRRLEHYRKQRGSSTLTAYS